MDLKSVENSILFFYFDGFPNCNCGGNFAFALLAQLLLVSLYHLASVFFDIIEEQFKAMLFDILAPYSAM